MWQFAIALGNHLFIDLICLGFVGESHHIIHIVLHFKIRRGLFLFHNETYFLFNLWTLISNFLMKQFQ